MTPALGGEWVAAQDAVAHTFVDELGDSVDISGPDGHHLQRVRRLRVGERMTAADGAGNWRAYDIAAIDSGRLQLAASGDRRTEPELVPRVALAVALTKAGSLDTVVARCTELGVARITPIRTRRSVVRWDAVQAERAVARLGKVAREAGAQCRRARLPEIAAVASLADFAGRPDLVVGDRGGGRIDALPEPRGGMWTVVIGPEGGLEADELETLGGATRLNLGPHVLRAETAPIAAVALLLSRSYQMFRE